MRRVFTIQKPCNSLIYWHLMVVELFWILMQNGSESAIWWVFSYIHMPYDTQMGCKSHLEGLRLHAQPSYVGGAISTEPQKIVTHPFHSLVVPLPHLRREVPALQCLRRWWWHPHPIQGTNGGAPSSLKRLSHGMLWDITWYMYTLCTLQTTSYSILYPGYMRIALVQVEITLSSYIGRCRWCTNPIPCRKEL